MSEAQRRTPPSLEELIDTVSDNPTNAELRARLIEKYGENGPWYFQEAIDTEKVGMHPDADSQSRWHYRDADGNDHITR